MFIFKRLHPQGGDRVAAPPRSCKSETPRGEGELGEIASKPPSSLLHTSAGATNLIYCYKLLLSDRPNIRYNLPPRQKSRTEPKSNSSCQPGTPTNFWDTTGMRSFVLCTLSFIQVVSQTSWNPSRSLKSLHQAPAHLAHKSVALLWASRCCHGYAFSSSQWTYSSR